VADTQQPVLVYDRIDANRRRTWLLLLVSGVILLPTLVLFAFPFSGFAMISILMMLDWPELSLTQSLVAYFGTLGGLALLTFLIALYISDWAILRLARARLVAPDEEQDYQRIVENLCIGGGLPLPRLYIIESSPPNAFSVGRDPDDSAIAVSRSLLALLNRNELEGVLAHELSHIGNRDTSLSTLTAAMSLSTQAAFLLLAGVGIFVRNLGEARWLLLFPPIFGFAVAFVVYLVMSAALTAPFALIGPFLRASISRGQEYLADADAVLLTRHAEGLATALTKMGAAGGPPINVGGATAHLYIVNAIPENAPWWDRMFSPHPPIEERVAVLAGMGSGIAPSVLREAEEAGARYRFMGTVATTVETDRVVVGQPETDELAVGKGAQSDEPRRLQPGFRLSEAGTTLYEKPDAISPAIAQLEEGALITVLETEGDFLRVLTADDSFGYISRFTGMTEVHLDGRSSG
jgi:heat shock protein HtpX